MSQFSFDTVLSDSVFIFNILFGFTLNKMIEKLSD